MENQIYNKPMYKCGICDEIYPTIAERMKCEQSCLKKQEEEAKKAAEAKKKEEQSSDFAEASAALDNALVLVNKCIEKHGIFKYSGKAKAFDLANMDCIPSKLWHHFWF